MTATASVTIQCPDLQITKEADDASVSAGEPIGFVITVTNGGPGTAYGVTLADQMPAGVDWSLQSSTAGAGCSLSATDLLTCGPVDLVDEGSISAHVVAQTTEADCALYENTASADATNDAQVTASDDTLVKCPGLNITKDADDPETVTVGDPVGFTIEVTNDEGDGIGTATRCHARRPAPRRRWRELVGRVPDRWRRLRGQRHRSHPDPGVRADRPRPGRRLLGARGERHRADR